MIVEKAPEGLTRVVEFDPLEKMTRLVKDYRTRRGALNHVDKENKKRTDPYDYVYYAFDDHGKFLRGDVVSGLAFYTPSMD